MDARQKRDGRAIEEIGLYHPKNDPSLIQVNSERAQYWLGVGAQPTEAVVALFKRSGDWQTFTGDKTPAGIDPQKPRPDRLARYTEAAGAAAELTEAVTTKKPSRGKKATEEVAAEVTEAPAEAVAEEAAAEPAAEPETAAEKTED